MMIWQLFSLSCPGHEPDHLDHQVDQQAGDHREEQGYPAPEATGCVTEKRIRCLALVSYIS